MDSPCGAVILLYTPATVRAFLGVDNILFFFFRYSPYRALVETTATFNAVLGNIIGQNGLLIDILYLD
jgi:hypothetical protein